MDTIRFAILGLGTGAVYAMLAQGLVLVYRSSGLLNFAQGGIAMFAGYVYLQFGARWGVPLWLAFIAAVVLSAGLGALIYVAVLRQMRKSSALARVIATLGILLVLQACATLIYSYNPQVVPSLLPIRVIRLFSPRLEVGLNIIIIFAVGLALTVVLSLVYRRTRFGKVTTAVAESEVVAASLGHSPNKVAIVNWALGSVLAAVAGVFVAPLIYLDPNQFPLLVIPAISAMLVGEFASFTVTFVVALLLGVANSELTWYVSAPGWASAAPFVVIVGILIIRGRGIPIRSFITDRLPAVGSGRIRVIPVVVLYGLGCWLIFWLNQIWASALTTSMALAIICLSVVVLTGYAGQLSLAQAVLAGTGALTAARLDAHMPFLAAILLATAITAIVGVLVGLPALRTRGITLAIVTLGVASAIADVVFDNLQWAGGENGIPVNTPSLFGWNIDPFFEASRYGFVVLTILVLLALAVANLRRGPVGRRMLAVRSNERAAAALGINVAGVKLYAFSVAAALAGLGGTLLGFQQTAVVTSGNTNFDVLACILLVGAVVITGVGSSAAALLAPLIIGGGIIAQIFNNVPSLDNYFPLIGGVALILTLVTQPDGIFEVNRRILRQGIDRLQIGRHRPPAMRWARRTAARSKATPLGRAVPQDLTVSDLSVTFGGVRALQGVSLEAHPGQVHGIIGPNGAGKTTLIDAVTGFVRASGGSIRLGSRNVTACEVRQRARAGLSRSFQSLELFDDLTVRENLAVAGDRSRFIRYVTDLVHPGTIRLNPVAFAAMRQFELDDVADEKPTNISFGRRKIVAIARAAATNPSVLLLDEPAAGLDDREAAELARLIRLLADEWGMAVVLVEHKIDVVMGISDRITVLDNGCLLTTGEPADIASDPRVHAAYLGTQAAEGENANTV